MRYLLNIERHDGLLALAEDECRRRPGGWKPKLRNKDLDPDHEGLTSRALPGAGTLELRSEWRVVAVPYHLPESSRSIIEAIDEAIAGQGRYARMLSAS